MQRLTGFDAAFLALESATNHMHVASLLIVDPRGAQEWSVERVRDLVRKRLPVMPPFRRRLVRVPFGINHPLWTDVPDVDLGFHVRHAALPRPGGRQELADVVADLMGRPLDRARPLWELHLIEGLEDGMVAVMIKAHHAALDGISATELLGKLLDVEAVPSGRAVREEALDADETAEPGQEEPSHAQLIGDALAGLPGRERLVGVVQRTVAAVIELRHRNTTAKAPPPLSPFAAPRTSLNVRIGRWRRVAWARLPISDVKAVTLALGGTSNDVVLALCSASLSSYFADRDEKPDGDLVALVPLSVRGGRELGSTGNHLSPMLIPLASQMESAGDRLRAISARTVAARSQDRRVQRDLLSEWAELAVPVVAVPASRLGSQLMATGALPPAFNLIVSNVPGPKRPMFLAGAPVTALYPLGPVLDGAALNVTVMSYGEHIHVGVVADRDALADVEGIAGGLAGTLAQLTKEAESIRRR